MTLSRMVWMLSWAGLVLAAWLVSGCIHADIGNMR